MKALDKYLAPPRLTLLLGIPAMLCMVILQATALNAENLFDRSHICAILLWLVTAVMVVLLAVSLRRLGGRIKNSRMFPVSAPGAAGILGAAAAMLWAGIRGLLGAAGMPEMLLSVLGLVSAAALVYLAWCRWRGLRTSFLLWICPTVYLMLRLMFAYQDWSTQSELLHYFFPLMASVCLTLAFYHRTAFCVGLGSRRMYLFFTQTAGFCCLVTLAAGFDLFYAGLGLWAILDLCNLRPMRTGKHERLPEEEK